MEPPSEQELADISRRCGFDLDRAALASFHELAADNLASHRRVRELYANAQHPMPQRHSEFPDDADNPLGAWYVRTQLHGQRSGPLTGQRIAVKDNIALAGVPMMNGSKAVDGHIPTRDATVVDRLFRAGAEITGKTVCEDLCVSAGSHTAATGPVRNPWDTRRSAGGSSSGSAALIANGDVDLALGSDQAGSLRVPAAFCGVVGHKPTHGLVPYTGAFPFENTLDHLGPLARSTAGIAALLNVIAGPDGLDPRQHGLSGDVPDWDAESSAGISGLRIGILDEGFDLPGGVSDSLAEDVVRTAAFDLAALGASVRQTSVPWHRDAAHVWRVLALEGGVTQLWDGHAHGTGWDGEYDPELIEQFAWGRREHANALAPTVKLIALLGRYARERDGGQHYAMARNLVRAVRAGYDAALAECDVLVLPTVPYTAPELPEWDAPVAESITASLGMLDNTAPLNATGHPAISVPVGFAHGMPVGMMIMARRFADQNCLRVARACERARGIPSGS